VASAPVALTAADTRLNPAPIILDKTLLIDNGFIASLAKPPPTQASGLTIRLQEKPEKSRLWSFWALVPGSALDVLHSVQSICLSGLEYFVMVSRPMRHQLVSTKDDSSTEPLHSAVRRRLSHRDRFLCSMSQINLAIGPSRLNDYSGRHLLTSFYGLSEAAEGSSCANLDSDGSSAAENIMRRYLLYASSLV
jgi:hypothetical protein